MVKNDCVLMWKWLLMVSLLFLIMTEHQNTMMRKTNAMKDFLIYGTMQPVNMAFMDANITSKMLYIENATKSSFNISHQSYGSCSLGYRLISSRELAMLL